MFVAGASLGSGRPFSSEDMENLLTSGLNVGHDIVGSLSFASSYDRTEDPHLSLLVLWLLKSALPFIQPEKPSKEGDGGSESTSSAILSHLCTLLDREEEGQSPATRSLAQEIVVKGVVVFFPDAKARKDYLLEMIESVLSEKQPRSWWLKFEALCQYFSTTDANSLLCLPTKIEEVCTIH